ncbi:unnamed protein product [Schistocephalus solidus]|uniref:CST complex subunit TEN1 n=1 Tax=Schistocephalus solidus TaxID=70667 RepID=A0A183ST80_SCHSO|nr:unnamed protein product [Schistocephalus solidus]
MATSEIVENASGVPSPALQASRLLSEQGSSVNTEKKVGSVDGRTVNSLDDSEEVLPLVVAGIFSDLLGLVSHSGVLHLPQPLLHKTVTSVKGYLVIGRVINEEKGAGRRAVCGQFDNKTVTFDEQPLIPAEIQVFQVTGVYFILHEDYCANQHAPLNDLEATAHTLAYTA